MAAFARPTLIRTVPGGLPTVGAIVAGLFVALVIAVTPGTSLVHGAAAIGVADPLASMSTALRLGLALGGGSAAAAVVWAALYLLVGPGGLLAARTPATDGVPSVRRADAHPDAPPRRPLTAAELEELTPAEPSLLLPAPAAEPDTAAPLPLVGLAERTVPADLDTPLAALDPTAIPATPLEPVRALAPLAPGERLETFALARPPRAAAPAEPPSIEALLRRLEAGAERRAARAG